MLTRRIRIVSLLVVLFFALTTTTSALAETPFEWLILEDNYDYDDSFTCEAYGFDVQSVGNWHMKAKVKIDEAWNILRNNAQTGYSGKLINKTTGNYIFERAQWTWNMAFENNVSTKSVLSGTQYQLVEPGGGVLYIDKGVYKYVGITIDLVNGTIIFTDPYHVAGHHDEYTEDIICDALK